MSYYQHYSLTKPNIKTNTPKTKTPYNSESKFYGILMSQHKADGFILFFDLEYSMFHILELS